MNSAPETSGDGRAHPDPRRLRTALAATWPAAETRRVGPFLLCRGAGGGNRVSAASLDESDLGRAGDVAVGIEQAETAMRAWGQVPLFRIAPGQTALDASLAARDYIVRDPTLILAAPVAAVAAPAGETAIFGSGPLASMAEIWAAGGIGPARLAVMARARGPCSYLLGRLDDHPAAAAFVALAGPIAMLHALAVAAPARRRGLGTAMTRAAAAWAERQGAETLALAVTRTNEQGLALYRSLGMEEADRYHYRAAAGEGPGS